MQGPGGARNHVNFLYLCGESAGLGIHLACEIRADPSRCKLLLQKPRVTMSRYAASYRMSVMRSYSSCTAPDDLEYLTENVLQMRMLSVSICIRCVCVCV